MLSKQESAADSSDLVTSMEKYPEVHFTGAQKLKSPKINPKTMVVTKLGPIYLSAKRMVLKIGSKK